MQATKKINSKLFLASLLVGTALVSPAHAATYTVLNNGANGADSFLEEAGTNANADGDVIEFDNAYVIANDPTTILANISIDTTAGNVTLSGNIADTSADRITKIGANTLTLSGTNTFSGGLTITAGTLSATTDAALGTGDITFNGGALTFTGTGETINEGFVMTQNGTATFANNNTLSGNITGASDLTKAGAGTLTLSGTNNGGTGGINVTAGGISITDDADLTTGTVTLNGGSMTITGTGQTIDNALSIGGSNGTITDANGNTFSGNITGAGVLTKAGAGTTVLSGTNGFSGGLTISAGYGKHCY